MSDAVLVAYATRYGSTQEVAEVVAAILEDRGMTVDVQPTRAVRSLEGYDAVVLGAPLYIMHWLKDARRFLERHEAALVQRPVVIFSLGPTQGEAGKFEAVREQLDKELAAYPWLTPVDEVLFGGKYDPAGLRFLDKVLAALPASPLYQLPANDLRDWDAIRAWAQGLDLSTTSS